MNLRHLEIFCLSLEHSSFTLAARVLGISPQAASRAVAKLEEELGVTLLLRHTRQMEPTAEGLLYYQTASGVLEALHQAKLDISPSLDTPRGTVRISAPTTYGHHMLLPHLPPFLDAFPQVRLDIQLQNHNVEFIRDRFDLAIRMGTLADASFISRRLGTFSLGLFAHPAYLERAGCPEHLDDLAHHRCALFVMPSSGKVLPWSFTHPDYRLTPRAHVLIQDDVLGLVSFAKAGGGIVQTYHFLVTHELEQGSLVEVLPHFCGASRPFSLIYPATHATPPHVQALIDHLL